MSKRLTWLFKIGLVFGGLLLTHPSQILLAKNTDDPKIVFNPNVLDHQSQASVSLIHNKNLKSKNKNVTFNPKTQNRRRNHAVSIQLANDIAYGLTIAQDKGQIKYGTKTYRKVQTAIFLLRRGAGLDGASRRSGVSRSLLDQLMKWGQQRPGALIDHVLD